jgi:PAS domain S-box-containing protein
MLDHEMTGVPTELEGEFDERFCEVMDSAPVMIWVSGPDKGCVWFNRPWLTFTGRSIAQEAGNGWTAGVHPDDFKRCLEIYVSHFDSRRDFRMEYRLRRHDGAYRWIDDIGVPRYTRAGHFLGYIGSCLDISQQKATEATLREIETRLRVAAASANLGIFERDIREDRTVWVNDRIYEIFGRSAEDGPLSKESFFRDYLHPDDVHKFSEAIEHAIRTGGHLHTTCRIHLKNGTERWLQIDGTYELTDTGEPIRLVGVAADITERKVFEKSAAELSERLINVQEEERQRIAQELHDSTTQHLVAANLNLMTLRPKVGLTPDEIRRWDDTETFLQEAAREIRTFSYLMHPPALEADKLIASIQQYVEGYADRTKIGVEMRLNPELDQLPYQMQRTVLRIVQEALANVHRHAAASRVRITCRFIAGRMHLIIGDDGRGLQGEQNAGSGRGIRGIQDRTHRWGGGLRIRSGSKGITVHVMWPVQRA